MAQRRLRTRGILITKLRDQLGWSQEKLADKAGIAKRTLQDMESGKGASADSIQKLAVVLKIDDWNQLRFGEGISENPVISQTPELPGDFLVDYDKEENRESAEKLVAAMQLLLWSNPHIVTFMYWRKANSMWIGTTVKTLCILDLIYGFAEGKLSEFEADGGVATVRALRFTNEALETSFVEERLMSTEYPYTLREFLQALSVTKGSGITCENLEDGGMEVSRTAKKRNPVKA